MDLFPIRNEHDYDRALARIDQLMSAAEGTPEADELDAWVTLVDGYEEVHFPMDTPSPASFIKFMLEQKGLPRKDLEPMIGSRARVSEVLSGKRNLTLAMIRKLHHALDIPLQFLIGPAPPTAPRPRRQPIVRRGSTIKPKRAARQVRQTAS